MKCDPTAALAGLSSIAATSNGFLVIDAREWGDDVRLSDLEPKSRARPAVAAAPMSDRYLSGPGREREFPGMDRFLIWILRP